MFPEILSADNREPGPGIIRAFLLKMKPLVYLT